MSCWSWFDPSRQDDENEPEWVQNLLHGAQTGTAAAQWNVSRIDHNSQQQSTFEFLDTSASSEGWHVRREEVPLG